MTSYELFALRLFTTSEFVTSGMICLEDAVAAKKAIFVHRRPRADSLSRRFMHDFASQQYSLHAFPVEAPFTVFRA